jgi:hypothetical protein
MTPSTPTSASTPAASMPTFLKFERGQMHSRFDREPFVIGHTLCEHPLLQLQRLIALSTTLPAASVEYNAGNIEVNQDPSSTPRTGLGIAETLRRLEECNSWMVLKNVEQDPEYAALLDACLDQVQPAVEDICPGMVGRKAYIFISSPGAITPYHVDFEYNFLLQVRGDKFMSVYDAFDRSLLSEEQRERAVSGAPRNLPFREEFEKRGTTFHLQPGDAVHVPLSSPHWVKVGSSVSISFSITFHSRVSDRRIGAHRTNAMLRKLGLSPTEVGRSDVLDTMKFNAHRVLRRIQSVGQKLRPGAGAGTPAAGGM